MTSTPDRPPEITPMVAWFSRHGIKVFAVLVVIELLFHAYAVFSAKRRDADAAAPVSATSAGAPRIDAH